MNAIILLIDICDSVEKSENTNLYSTITDLFEKIKTLAKDTFKEEWDQLTCWSTGDGFQLLFRYNNPESQDELKKQNGVFGKNLIQFTNTLIEHFIHNEQDYLIRAAIHYGEIRSQKFNINRQNLYGTNNYGKVPISTDIAFCNRILNLADESHFLMSEKFHQDFFLNIEENEFDIIDLKNNYCDKKGTTYRGVKIIYKKEGNKLNDLAPIHKHNKYELKKTVDEVKNFLTSGDSFISFTRKTPDEWLLNHDLIDFLILQANYNKIELPGNKTNLPINNNYLCKKIEFSRVFIWNDFWFNAPDNHFYKNLFTFHEDSKVEPYLFKINKTNSLIEEKSVSNEIERVKNEFILKGIPANAFPLNKFLSSPLEFESWFYIHRNEQEEKKNKGKFSYEYKNEYRHYPSPHSRSKNTNDIIMSGIGDILNVIFKIVISQNQN